MVEVVGEQANILVDDYTRKDEDKDIVGMGFPIPLAKSLVKRHNTDLEALYTTIANKDEIISHIPKVGDNAL